MGRSPKSFAELGVSGGYQLSGGIRYTDTVAELRGMRGIRKFREMTENDPTVGAILSGIKSVVMGARWKFDPKRPPATAEDPSPAPTPEAIKMAHLMDDMFDDMAGTRSDFFSDALSCLSYGFSLFEIVLKRRSDGLYGIKKLSPRAPWTIDSFVYDDDNEFVGVRQQHWRSGIVVIPRERLVHFCPTPYFGDPAGLSLLRNAYRPWYYLSHIQDYEAVAIERELNGLPVGRVPAKYLASTASDEEKSFVDAFKTILRDVKRNAQGFVLLPSDLHEDAEGKLSEVPLVGLELLTSKGGRDVNTDPIVRRYQADVARSVLADFMTLGQNDRGSYAMSASKADLFVKALRHLLQCMADPVNRDVVPYVWEANALDPELMPTLTFQNFAQADLNAVGVFLRSLALAGARVFPDDEIENALLALANLPPRSRSNEEMDEVLGPRQGDPNNPGRQSGPGAATSPSDTGDSRSTETDESDDEEEEN